MKYANTILIANPAELSRVKPGQWVQFDSGMRGQYMGTTRAGVTVIRYQSGRFGRWSDTRSNKLLRDYARINGAK